MHLLKFAKSKLEPAVGEDKELISVYGKSVGFC
jgi:hypothetical protein